MRTARRQRHFHRRLIVTLGILLIANNNNMPTAMATIHKADIVLASGDNNNDESNDNNNDTVSLNNNRSVHHHHQDSNKCSWGVCNDEEHVVADHGSNNNDEKKKEELINTSEQEGSSSFEQQDNTHNDNDRERVTTTKKTTTETTNKNNHSKNNKAHIPFVKGNKSKNSQKRSQGPPTYPSSASQQQKQPVVDHHDSTEDNSNNNNVVQNLPPEGFVITNRVYTDPNDKLAHFDDGDDSYKVQLPYWECSATGSTTTPLPVRNAYFRHALSGSHPTIWSGTEYGPHPQLVIALKPIIITLNSGESKTFQAGDVILLEDVVSGGHKIMSPPGGKDDMVFLLLTLPQHYHHVGKDRLSIKKATSRTKNKKQNPCPIKDDTMKWKGGGEPLPDSTSSRTRSLIQSKSKSLLANFSPIHWNEDQIRLLLLGTAGVSLTTFIADFLGKVAPLWLAVGIGGTCFIAGGTYGFVKAGEYVWEEIETWVERRRLGVAYSEEDVLLDMDEDASHLAEEASHIAEETTKKAATAARSRTV